MKSIFFALAALAMATTAQANVILDTGVGNAPWTTQVDLTSIPTGIWINATAPAKWVGKTANDGNISSGAAPGPYTFTLPIGTYASGPGTFSLNYAADNAISWSIDDGGTLSGPGCAGPDCFTISSGAPFALTGTYGANSILTASITNTGSVNTPMGFLVQGGVAISNSAVPEPSTYAMVAIGVAGILLSLKRRA